MADKESPDLPSGWSDVHKKAYKETKNPLEIQFVVMLSRDFDVPVPTWVRDALAGIFERYWGTREKLDLDKQLGAKRGKRQWNRFHHNAREAENLRLAWFVGQRLEAEEGEDNKTELWLTLADELGWESNTIQNRWRDELKPVYDALKADLKAGEEPWFLNDTPRN